MARRPRIFAPGLLYHVIARGNHQQETFRDKADYLAYLARLARYRNRYGVVLHAYCLMPNHVHLLARVSDTPLAAFMQSLQQSYTQRFNRVHTTVGHLFQGRYKAIACDTDSYLIALVRYIHLNPVRAGLVSLPEKYPYSGHRTYLEGRPTPLLDPLPILDLLGGREAYRRHVLAALGTGHEPRYYEVADQQLLGDQQFVESARRRAGEVDPSCEKVVPRPLDMALEELTSGLGVTVGALRSLDRSRRLSAMRTTVAFVLVKRRGYRLTDVAASLRRDIATVSSALSRMTDRLATDERLERSVRSLDAPSTPERPGQSNSEL